MMGVLKLLSALFLLSLLRPGLSHVVETFSDECKEFFLKEYIPNIPGILDNGNVGPDQKHYKPICQKYKNTYRFVTLYDTTNKIPVFSAYKFTGDAGARKNVDETWKIEPQLEDITADKSMAVSQGAQYEHQATNQDYIDSIPNKGVNRGHLFPCMHADGDDAKESTFTLTNAVPQAVTFNNGSWRVMEEKVRDIMKQSCKDNNQIKAYVVTGAVPSKNPEKKLKDKMNIPTFMWTAYCCENPHNQWHSGAHWGENKENGVTTSHTVADLNSKLKDRYYKGEVQVFPQECLTPSFFKPNV